MTAYLKSQANCDSWAEYETRGSSPSSNLCHGGYYDGDYFEACPARSECKQATKQRAATSGRKRTMPVLNAAKPVGSPRSGIRELATTSNLEKMETHFGKTPEWKTRTSLPGKKTTTTAHTPAQVPVIPPKEYPVALRTPHMSPHPMAPTGGVTPTFLPDDKPDRFSRLGKNIAQGMIGVTGWHVHEYLRHVDMFG